MCWCTIWRGVQKVSAKVYSEYSETVYNLPEYKHTVFLRYAFDDVCARLRWTEKSFRIDRMETGVLQCAFGYEC